MDISNGDEVSVEEGKHLAATPDLLELVRNSQKNEDNCYVIRPAQLASSLGLSIEDATRELCGLLSAVGGGQDGASFVFEKVELPDAASTTTTSMVFTFPHDFERRALRHRRNADFKQRLRSLSTGIVKATKIFTAFGLIISLAVVIIAGICVLVAAVIAMARGGHGGGGHRNHPLMHRILDPKSAEKIAVNMWRRLMNDYNHSCSSLGNIAPAITGVRRLLIEQRKCSLMLLRRRGYSGLQRSS